MESHKSSKPYNPYDCGYCLYYKGERIGCVYDGCCCPVPQKPERRKGITIHYDEKTNESHISECVDCPYGRDSPCIGWCMKEVMRSVGLIKEKKDNV